MSGSRSLDARALSAPANSAHAATALAVLRSLHRNVNKKDVTLLSKRRGPTPL
ncbi:hypothetical protein [Nocardia araoensis]|uniref:hypothetical protein n=1 Tax=Nocardia araoensis TaxID=228600 RepID=UPI0002F28D4A|nr:hypothetical protein [Nocardia araoensis]